MIWFVFAFACALTAWLTGDSRFILLLLAFWLAHVVFDSRRGT